MEPVIKCAVIGVVVYGMVRAARVAYTYRPPVYTVEVDDPDFVVVTKRANEIISGLSINVTTRKSWYGGMPLIRIYANGRPLHWNIGPSMVFATLVIYTNDRGQYHRGNHMPAVLYNNGREEWWRNGKWYKPFRAIRLDEHSSCT